MTTPETKDMSASEDSSVFTDHVLLYLDFLGVSAAATSWSEDRAARLIDVLRGVAGARGPFDLDGASQPDGSFKFQVTAEVSTFSDHIVASYVVPDETSSLLDIVMAMYVSLTRDMVARVAVHALNVGLLVRGGLTFGKLYHSDGVVFGEAMIDAYRLESSVAIYPRIAVSSRIYEKLSDVDRDKLLQQDSDGISDLDYFARMLKSVPESERDGWIKSVATMIDQNVSAFEEAEKWNEFSKWRWFHQRFNRLVKA